MALHGTSEIHVAEHPSDLCVALLEGLPNWLEAAPMLVLGRDPAGIGVPELKRDLGRAFGIAPVFLQLRETRRDIGEGANCPLFWHVRFVRPALLPFQWVLTVNVYLTRGDEIEALAVLMHDEVPDLADDIWDHTFSTIRRQHFKLIIMLILRGRLAVDHRLSAEDASFWRAPLLSLTAAGPRCHFEALLALRADVNKPDSRGHTPLVYAVLANSHARTTLLLRAGAMVAPDTGYCPLLLSVAKRQRQMVHILLHARACPYRRSSAGSLRGLSPHGLAYQWDDSETMRAFRIHGHHAAGPHPAILPVSFSLSGNEVALSEVGAEHASVLQLCHRMPTVGLSAEEHSDRVAITYNSSVCPRAHASALQCALSGGDHDLAANILERRPDLIQKSDYRAWGFNNLPLLWAVEHGEAGAVCTLLQARASPNVTRGSAAPLLIAARQGDLSLAAMLLLARADVNLVSADGRSALSIGASFRNLPLVSLLLEFRAHVSPRPEVLSPVFQKSFLGGGRSFDHCAAAVLLLRAAGALPHSVVHAVLSELVPQLMADGNWKAIFAIQCWAQSQLGLQPKVGSDRCFALASGS
ncbi:Ank2 [Symbiodinium sp. CCMP2592]|nr:Ank2 [Symbiodinium sp. CCMP2592]